MLIDAKGRYGKHICLGIQTTPDDIENRMFHMVLGAASKNAQSFTCCIVHTDYHGHFTDVPTGYATVAVRYFSRKNEGLVKIER